MTVEEGGHRASLRFGLQQLMTAQVRVRDLDLSALGTG